MSDLGSKLAQLAKASAAEAARKNAQVDVTISREDRERIEAETTSANIVAIQNVLLPHVQDFNRHAEPPLRIALRTAPPFLIIERDEAKLLTIEVAARSALTKRKAGFCILEDSFTIGTSPDGAISFRNHYAGVERRLNPSQFSEQILMEALGLSS